MVPKDSVPQIGERARRRRGKGVSAANKGRQARGMNVQPT